MRGLYRNRMTACLLLIALAMTGATAYQSPASDDGAPDDVLAAQADTGHTAGQDSTTSDGLPVRISMQRLGADMSGFTQVMLLEDYEQMTVYADDIVHHPDMTPAEIQRIKSELGQEMDGFVAADEAVYTQALRLQEAAEARDMDLTLRRLHELQVGCVTCHVQFRQRLRTDLPAR